MLFCNSVQYEEVMLTRIVELVYKVAIVPLVISDLFNSCSFINNIEHNET